MNAIRIWNTVFWGSLLVSLILYFLYPAQSPAGGRNQTYWKEYFELQVLHVLEDQSADKENAENTKWPFLIQRDGKPIFWSTSFSDSSILQTNDEEIWICPDGNKWYAFTGQLDSTHQWIGLIPASKLVTAHASKRIDIPINSLEACPGSLSAKRSGIALWQVLLLIPVLILPWFFLLKFPMSNLKTILLGIGGTAAYFITLGILTPYLTAYLGIVPEGSALSSDNATNILTTLFKSFFLFYLGQLFYKHEAWQLEDLPEGIKKKKLWLTGFYLLTLVAIIAGVQVLENITQREWLNLHFILGDSPPVLIFYGSLAWLFGMGGVILIALRITRFIHSLLFNTRDRIVSMLIATAVISPFTLLPQISVSLTGLILTGLASMLFLDLFVEEEKPSLSWILASFLLISALTTALGYNQAMKQEKEWAGATLINWYDNEVEEPTQLRYHLDNWTMDDLNRYQILYRENPEERYAVMNDWLTSGNESWIEPLSLSGTKEKIFAISSDDKWMISRSSLDLLQPLSLFSRIFAILIGIFSLLTLVNYQWPFLPERFGLAIFAQHSLRTRIQIGILATILVSFLIIGLITQYYYVQNKKSVEYNTMKNQVSQLASLCFGALDNEDETESTQQLRQLENSFLARITIFDKDQPSAVKMAVPQNILSAWQNDIPFIRPTQQGPHPHFYASDGGSTLLSIEWKDRPWNTFFTSNLISTLLSVYVFLFLLAGSIGLAIANSITWPIEILAEKIKQVRLGKQNEPLKWNNPDELGELIRVYNEMIEKLDHSARSMVKLERDMAWREMAQQVAHEIKNPLTPMKLSIQYLMQTVGSDPERLQQLVPRVSETLLEQVDNLSTIATEFSNFGTLPKANNAKVNLNEVVASVHDLFRKRDDLEINLYVPIEDLWVFVDRNYMIRVLNNLIKNAIQAIPADRDGKIDIILKKVDDNAQIIIRDNGIGIPDDMKEKVFEPNFTTKSSGTGLGLAICASLLESFNGVIYFETKPGKGTEFFVDLPLMLVENNFKHIPRVNLDD